MKKSKFQKLWINIKESIHLKTFFFRNDISSNGSKYRLAAAFIAAATANCFFDLPDIETDLLEIQTDLPEIKTAMHEIETALLQM